MKQNLYNDVFTTCQAMESVGYTAIQIKQTMLSRTTFDNDINVYWKRIDNKEFTLHEFVQALRKALKNIKQTFFQPQTFNEWQEDILNN